MTIDEECVSCIINQSVKVAQAINANDALSNSLTSAVQKLSKDFSYNQNPPEIASYVYEKMAQIAGKTDLYDEIKVSTAKITGLYGARGVGEHTMIPTPAAIANAVYKATGVRIHDLPVTTEKVLKGMNKLKGK